MLFVLLRATSATPIGITNPAFPSILLPQTCEKKNQWWQLIICMSSNSTLSLLKALASSFQILSTVLLLVIWTSVSMLFYFCIYLHGFVLLVRCRCFKVQIVSHIITFISRNMSLKHFFFRLANCPMTLILLINYNLHKMCIASIHNKYKHNIQKQ